MTTAYEKRWEEEGEALERFKKELADFSRNGGATGELLSAETLSAATLRFCMVLRTGEKIVERVTELAAEAPHGERRAAALVAKATAARVTPFLDFVLKIQNVAADESKSLEEKLSAIADICAEAAELAKRLC